MFDSQSFSPGKVNTSSDRISCARLRDRQLFAPIRAQQPRLLESAPLRPMGVGLCLHVQVSRQKRFRAKTDQQLVWMSISWDNNNKNDRKLGRENTFIDRPHPVGSERRTSGCWLEESTWISAVLFRFILLVFFCRTASCVPQQNEGNEICS